VYHNSLELDDHESERRRERLNPDGEEGAAVVAIERGARAEG
jgi:hypothetical protein